MDDAKDGWLAAHTAASMEMQLAAALVELMAAK
jgi:hypothetical protein